MRNHAKRIDRMELTITRTVMEENPALNKSILDTQERLMTNGYGSLRGGERQALIDACKLHGFPFVE